MARSDMRLVLRLLTLLLVLPLISGLAVQQPRGRAVGERATIPSKDPFYKPPAGFESKKPGDILRRRRIIASFFGIIPDLVEAHQLLYRTTAMDGSPIATVTTIFKPLFAKRDRFVSFATAYDSSASICNPSYNYQLGALQTDLVSSAEYLLIQAYLASGYVVASADYEGPDTAFTAGRLSGMGVLDGMRAVRNFASSLGLNSNPMIVGAGYSGGAIGNGWAASLHSSYAPELPVKGWTLGGTPANLTAVWLKVDGGVFSGFLPGAVAGLSKPSAYGAQMQPLLDTILTPYGKSVLSLANTQCVPVNLIAFAGKSLLSTDVQSLGPSILSDPAIAPVLTDTTMGVKKQEMPSAPVFMYHAPDDQIIPYAPAKKLSQTWCDNGGSVQFTTYGAGGHITTEVVAIIEALQFASDAFAGRVSRGCSSKTVLRDSFSPFALGLSLEPILAALGGILLVLGKGDANLVKDISIIKT